MLSELIVRPVTVAEEARFQTLMQAHHYLGALPKIGHTLWYVATCDAQWLAVLSFSAAALKCGARDRWIGWDLRHHYDRLHLIANQSRFVILPQHHHPNLASRVLSLCRRRIQADWVARFGFPLLLLETFVDPERFVGTIYRASSWQYVGDTRGYQRCRPGEYRPTDWPKRVFVQPLQPNARTLLSGPLLPEPYHHGSVRMKLSAEHMKALPAFFRPVPDPRRTQGRRHPLASVLAIATAAVLCGARGYKAIAQWAQALSPQALARFRCRYRNGHYQRPSASIIRDLLIRVDPKALDHALQQWSAHYGVCDQSLAIDAKTLHQAIHEYTRQGPQH
jgi:hypothetical protein